MYINKANALYNLKRFSEAAKACEKAIKIDSTEVIAYKIRAWYCLN